MQTPAGESGAGVEEELAQAREAAAVQEKEFGELLACLGQESAKSAAFQELLLQHGIDPSGVLAQVCALCPSSLQYHSDRCTHQVED